MMKGGECMVLYIVIAVVVIVLLWFICVSNKLRRLIVKIEEADSGIDVALTKRYDVLTKMIDVVKGYSKHEKETLFKVIEMRKGMNVSEKQDVMKKMNDSFKQIEVLAESYPELKSSENYNTLQLSIADTEEHLQAARRMYNSNVSKLNQMVVTFPYSIVAGMKGIKEHSFFEADEEKKQDVKIDL